MTNKIVYYKDGNTVKGRYKGCDTTSTLMKGYIRVEKSNPDPVLDQNYADYKATIPPSINQDKIDYDKLLTNEEKISFLAKKLGLS